MFLHCLGTLSVFCHNYNKPLISHSSVLKQLPASAPLDTSSFSLLMQNHNFFSLSYFLFHIQRDTELECFHGSWDREVSCQPVDCGPPDQSHVYHAIFSCPWGTTFGKQCSFTCGAPAILQGKSWFYIVCHVVNSKKASLRSTSKL